MYMKILLIGSDGFVGKEVAKLLEKKHTLKGYDQTNGKNILNVSDLEEEMRGTDVVIHLAAIIENDSPQLWEVNVKGTKNVVEAAAKNKVKKLIFLSSTGVYGCPKEKVNEKSETRPENNYEKSKLEAEKIVLGHKEKICVNIIRSAMVLGANNYWKKMFNLLKKNYPLPCGGKNTFQVTYVKELARAIETVLKKGKCGETYLVATKEKWTLNEFCETGKKLLGMKNTKVKHVPGFIGVIIGKITGSKTLTAENIRHLSKERNYDLRKITKLSYKQKQPLKEAIQEIVKELN